MKIAPRFLLITLALLSTNMAASSQRPAEQVRPGASEVWKRADVERIVQQLESDVREAYREREQIAKLFAPQEGSAIADVGAGSGFMTMLFARMVGARGKVYAVEINPGLVEHIARRAKKRRLPNVVARLTPEESVTLPANSVDLVFLMLTYQFFEYPERALAGLHRALKPGGELLLVEERGTEEQFTRELVTAGFEFLRQESAPFLRDLYARRFRKKSAF